MEPNVPADQQANQGAQTYNDSAMARMNGIRALRAAQRAQPLLSPRRGVPINLADFVGNRAPHFAVTQTTQQLIEATMSKLPAAKRHMLLERLLQADSAAGSAVIADLAAAPPADLPARLEGLVAEVQAAPAPQPAAEGGVDAAAPMDIDGAAAAAAAGPSNAAPPSAAAAAAAEPALSLRLVPELREYGTAAVPATRAVASLVARHDEAASRRSAVALTCVLDVSGSMGGDRLQLVQATCHFLVDQLGNDDYLSLVTYSNNVRTPLPLGRMSPAAKRFAHAVVDGLAASGGTALYDGLRTGMEKHLEELVTPHQQAAAQQSQQLVHGVFLCTDGEANSGPQDADTIIPLLHALQGSGPKLTVHTFGFGSGHAAGLLQALADAQSGSYYYVAASHDIPKAYGDALGGLLSVVATGIKLRLIAGGDGVSLLDVKAGGIVFKQPGGGGGGGGGSALITFADVFSEERREVLALLGLPAVEAAATGDAAVAGGAAAGPSAPSAAAACVKEEEEGGAAAGVEESPSKKPRVQKATTAIKQEVTVKQEELAEQQAAPAAVRVKKEEEEVEAGQPGAAAVLAAATTATTTCVLVAELEYVDVLTGETVKVTQRLDVPRRAGAAAAAAAAAIDPLVATTAARYRTAEAIEAAQALAQGGRAQEALSRLDAFVAQLGVESSSISHAAAAAPAAAGSAEAAADALRQLEGYSAQVQAVRSTLVSDDINRNSAAMTAVHYASASLRVQRASAAGVSASMPSSRMFDNKGKAEARKVAHRYTSSRQP